MSESGEKYLRGSWLAKLMSVHTRPHRVFTITEGRLKGTTFAVRWLSAEDHTKSIDEARKYLIENGKWDPVDLYTGAGANRLEFESQIQLISRALVDPDAPDTQACAGPEDVRKRLDADEVRRIYDEWDDFQAERSPWRRWKDAAAFEADVDSLGKGLMSEAWLRCFDSASLRSIVQSLVSRLRTQTKDSSADTSPQNSFGAELTNDD